MLTPKLRKVLFFIEDYSIAHGGIPPSYQEIADSLGIASKGNVHRFIVGLERRGFIARLPDRARSIEVLKLPRETPLTDGHP